jgi:hypothetical protein
LHLLILFAILSQELRPGVDLQIFSAWLSLRRVTLLLAGAHQRNHLVSPGEGDHAGRVPVEASHHGFQSSKTRFFSSDLSKPVGTTAQ